MHIAWTIPTLCPPERLANVQQRWPARGNRVKAPYMADLDGKRRRPGRPPKRSSQFDRAVDDLMMKKYGRGHIYYGNRARLNEGEFAVEQVDDPDTSLSDYEFLKEDAILVVGGTGRTGQWIVLKLLSQGFNVRVLTREFGRAEDMFGPSGANVDIFQGDICDPKAVVDAVEGAKAVVIAAAPDWWRLNGSKDVEGKGAAVVIEAASKCPSVRRVVLMSAVQDTSSRAKSKLSAENALRECQKPYIILRLAALEDNPGGISDIVMSQDSDLSAKKMRLSRVDAAEAACQALVFDKSVLNDNTSSENVSSVLKNYCVNVANSTDPVQEDADFWTKQLNQLVPE